MTTATMNARTSLLLLLAPALLLAALDGVRGLSPSFAPVSSPCSTTTTATPSGTKRCLLAWATDRAQSSVMTSSSLRMVVDTSRSIGSNSINGEKTKGGILPRRVANLFRRCGKVGFGVIGVGDRSKVVRFGSSNDDTLDRNRVKPEVRPRPTVRLDPTTGLFVPTRKEPSASMRRRRSSSLSGKKWDAFKETVYSTTDALSAVPSKLGGRSKERSTPQRRPSGGYSDTIEKIVGVGRDEEDRSPGARLLRRQYERLNREEERGDVTGDAKRKIRSVLDGAIKAAFSKTTAGDESSSEATVRLKPRPPNTFPPTKAALIAAKAAEADPQPELAVEARSSPPQKRAYGNTIRGALDRVKDGMYGAADGLADFAAASATGDDGQEEKATATTAKIEGFRPLSRPSANEEPDVVELRRIGQDFSSSNPLVRFRAQWAAKLLRSKRKRQREAARRAEVVEKAKEAAFGVADGAVKTVEFVADVPAKVAGATSQAREVVVDTVNGVRSVPYKIKDVASEVQTIPGKVEKAVKDVRSAANETARATRAAVEDVRNLPAAMERTAAKIDDVTYSVKVMAGLEKPRPKPPPPPPPLPSTTQATLRVTGSIAGTTARVAWFVGKGAVGLGIAGAKTAWKASSSTKEPSSETDNASTNILKKGKRVSARTVALKQEPQIVSPAASFAAALSPSLAASQSASSSGEMTETLQSVFDVDRELGMKVSDALALAEEAMADKIKDGKKEEAPGRETSLASSRLSEMDDALRRAREAALEATRDAAELEKMLLSRRASDT